MFYSNQYFFQLFTILLLSFSVIELNAEEQKISQNVEILRKHRDKHCLIADEENNVTFNLTSLGSDLNYKIKVNTNDFIEFNVCGNTILKPCNGLSNVEACYTKNGKEEHILAPVDSELKISNGKMHFSYVGDKCNKNSNYTLDILLLCDNKTSKHPFIKFTSEDQCNIFGIWKTNLVCLNKKEAKVSACTAIDTLSGNEFNLLPLSEFKYNVTNINTTFFTINICKPILNGYNDLCPIGSSVCFMNKTEPNLFKRFKDYGQTASNLVYDNGELYMKFQSGEKCTNNENITSVINFRCDHKIEFGEPEFIGKAGCVYSFSWHTSYACNDIRKPCVVVDRKTGTKYDLTSLSKKNYTVSEGEQKYEFGVCTASKSSCSTNVGACHVNKNQTTSLGVLNDRMMFNETGSPYLKYEKGSVCGKLGQKWATQIEFVCSYDDKNAKPKLIENTNCLLIIQFPTDIVCQQKISCRIEEDGKIMDLTALIKSTNNYIARVNDSLMESEGPPVLYYVNVCRSLVPKYGLNCSGGSAACRVVNGSKTAENELSLGYADVSLTLVDSQPHLLYSRGGKCPTAPEIEATSHITFYCNAKAGHGTPILQEISSDCFYRFDWPTNVICPKYKSKLNAATCTIQPSDTKIKFDFHNVTDKHGKIRIRVDDKNVDLDICKSDAHVEVDYTQSSVKLFFKINNSKLCSTTEINTEFRFMCRKHEGEFDVSYTQSCNLLVTKETPTVCDVLGNLDVLTDDDPDDSKNNTTDNDDQDTSSSSWGTIFIILAIVSVVGGVGYILKSPDRRDKIKAIFQRRNTSVQYSRVQQNTNFEEANLLMASAENVSSDDELLI